jgi:uracil DNA glycosylase
MSKIEKFYRKKISQDWQAILDKFNIVKVLESIEENFKLEHNKSSICLLKPFYYTDFNTFKVILVGNTFGENALTNGCFFDTSKGLNQSTEALIKEMQSIKGFKTEDFDISIKPMLKEGVLSTIYTPCNPYNKENQWSIFIEKFIKFMQNSYSGIVYCFFDFEGFKLNYNVPVLHYKTEYIIGSRFQEEINNTLKKIGKEPINWESLINRKPTYDVRRIMLKSRKS